VVHLQNRSPPSSSNHPLSSSCRCASIELYRRSHFPRHEFSPHLFTLIDHDRNYSSYRQAHESIPGLPFLPPHVRQLRHSEQKALCEVFSFMLRKPARAQRQELGRKEPQRERGNISWKAWTWATIKGAVSCSAARRVRERGAPRHAPFRIDGRDHGG